MKSAKSAKPKIINYYVFRF